MVGMYMDKCPLLPGTDIHISSPRRDAGVASEAHPTNMVNSDTEPTEQPRGWGSFVCTNTYKALAVCQTLVKHYSASSHLSLSATL